MATCGSVAPTDSLNHELAELRGTPGSFMYLGTAENVVTDILPCLLGVHTPCFSCKPPTASV